MPRRKVLIKSAEERGDAAGDPLQIWDLQLVFDRPFKYRTDAGALVLQITVFGNDQGNKHFPFPLDATKDGTLSRRIHGDPEKGTGTIDDNALVVRFDVLARAAARTSRPDSRTSSRPGASH